VLDKRRLGLMSSDTGGGITRALLLTSIIFIVTGFTMCVGSNAWDIGIGWGIFVLMLGVGFLCVYIAKFSPALPIWITAPLAVMSVDGAPKRFPRSVDMYIEFTEIHTALESNSKKHNKQFDTDYDRNPYMTLNDIRYSTGDLFKEELKNQIKTDELVKKVILFADQSILNYMKDSFQKTIQHLPNFVMSGGYNRQHSFTAKGNIATMDAALTLDLIDIGKAGLDANIVGDVVLSLSLDIGNNVVNYLHAAVSPIGAM